MKTADLAELVNSARALIAEVNTCVPARVVAYDPATRRADVRPEIDKKTADGRVIEAPTIFGIKVKFLASTSSNAIISMPLNQGDGGLLHFSQRSIEQFMEGVRVPEDPRMHDLNDAFFSPGIHTDSDTIAAEGDCLLIKIGSSIIRMYGDGKAVATFPGGYRVEAPLTTFTGDVAVQGKVNVNKTIDAIGIIKSQADVLAKVVSLLTHIHTAVQGGNGTSGPPK